MEESIFDYTAGLIQCFVTMLSISKPSFEIGIDKDIEEVSLFKYSFFVCNMYDMVSVLET